MKKEFIFSVFVICVSIVSVSGQKNSKTYEVLLLRADSLYNIKDYKNSAFAYSEAFNANGGKALYYEFYNAAECWAKANYPDSAFYYLDKFVVLADYSVFVFEDSLIIKDLKTLNNDSRWQPFMIAFKEKKNKLEAHFNKPLIAELDTIYKEDQTNRLKISDIIKNYGWESKEMNNLWKIIKERDSVNLIKVTFILDKYGWLGADIIGQQGNTTIFLVIQHAKQPIREKYLPMMKEAVKKGNAQASNLALLEDRVAIWSGKKQIYGSQIFMDNETKRYYVCPLDNPDNVDERRAEVGLGTLAEYVKQWQIIWDIEQYKKDLPQIELINAKMIAIYK